MIPVDIYANDDPYSLHNLFFRPPHFAREVDRKFYEEMSDITVEGIIKNLDKAPPQQPEVPKFNGVDIPQPLHVVRSDEITVDHYSDRPECLVQSVAIEAAERAICRGAITDRFGIIHGLAEGVPADCFPNRRLSDPTFYLVDKDAMEAGLPCCLVQFWVDKRNDRYTFIPFTHVHEFGNAVRDELIRSATE